MQREKSTGVKELQLVVFKVGDEEFGVEINQVKEIVRIASITAIPRAPSFLEGVINLRGHILVVIDLASKLKLKAKERCDKTRIIVIEVGEDIVGMIVDEVSEVIRMPVENIEATPSIIDSEIQYEYLRGVGKLGERLLILIDLAKILSAEEMEDVKKAASVETKKENKDID